jgi:hypothetical protein
MQGINLMVLQSSNDNAEVKTGLRKNHITHYMTFNGENKPILK